MQLSPRKTKGSGILATCARNTLGTITNPTPDTVQCSRSKTSQTHDDLLTVHGGTVSGTLLLRTEFKAVVVWVPRFTFPSPKCTEGWLTGLPYRGRWTKRKNPHVVVFFSNSTSPTAFCLGAFGGVPGCFGGLDLWRLQLARLRSSNSPFNRSLAP